MKLVSNGVRTTAFILLFGAHMRADTFTVTNTNDSGSGSLRQAIMDANAHANSPATTPDMIVFAIPGSGVHTISPTSKYPDITDPVVIDATTQGSSSTPLIELDGTNAGDLVSCLGISNTSNVTIRGFAINRFEGIAITLIEANGCTLQGNFIGTNPAGSVAQGNGTGITIADFCDNNLIGGTAPGTRNVISGNSEAGFQIFSQGTGNMIQGNYIGTDVTGSVALGNGVGISMSDSAHITIGGSVAGAGNVISGNLEDGINIFELPVRPAAGHVIVGNLIGRNAANSSPLGNGGRGIYFFGTGGNIIGAGSNPNGANTIAHNGLAGIAIVTANGAAITNSIRENRIFSNGGLGIDLGDDGVTPNDPLDTDTGANGLQNFPVLTSATSSGANTDITGNLNSEPNKSYRIEFFASVVSDPSGHGEGQTFLGAIDVMTGSSGDAPFATLVPAPTIFQPIISATATHTPEMSDSSENTSEFSSAIQIFGTRDKLENVSGRMRVLTGDNVLIGGFIISGSAPLEVLIRSAGPSMTSGGNPVPGTLQDPTLSLRDANGNEIEFNDDWMNAPEPERTLIANSGLAPTDSREPAIERTLSPGAYTAIVRGRNDSTGIATVEVYDRGVQSRATPGPNGLAVSGRLANISTRGFCSTNDNVMIGGTIIGNGLGGGSHVLIRALGPSLKLNGVALAGRMMDPSLELHDANGAILISNDNWKSNQQQEIENTNLIPGDDKEAALLTILPPGASTVILSGQNGSTGIALIEIYELPENIPPPTD